MLYLKSLEIENVRCFARKQRIDFTGKDGEISQWTVILGDNGTGKTSILRSIVSLLPSPQVFLQSRHYSETDFDISINDKWEDALDIRRQSGEKDSIISLNVIESGAPFGKQPKLEMQLQHHVMHEGMVSLAKFNTLILSPVYCFAYGANRKMAEKSFSNDSLKDISETLFKDDALLQNSSEYFLRLDYETAKSKKGNSEKNKVKDLLLRVLPSGIKDIEVYKSGHLQREVRVKTDYGWVKLGELSLGYKTTIAWLIDFATKMIAFYQNFDDPFDQPAIFILDEIDLHMHPAWQREIIEKLTVLFPKTQFIVTAHSPLIAQAALSSNLVLLRKMRDHVKVENTPEVIKSWRIDQILTSDLFGLKEARPKNIERKISRRQTLLRKIDLTDLQRKELEKLNKEIYDMPIGETKLEIDAMDVLKKFAEKLQASKMQNND